MYASCISLTYALLCSRLLCWLNCLANSHQSRVDNVSVDCREPVQAPLTFATGRTSFTALATFAESAKNQYFPAKLYRCYLGYFRLGYTTVSAYFGNVATFCQMQKPPCGMKLSLDAA